MNVPRNVLLFEVMLYLSLTLDALSVAFQDRTPGGQMTDQAIAVSTLMQGGMILLLVLFVYLAPQQRKNWPRWVLAAVLVLSVISLVAVIGERGVELDSGIEIVSCVLTAWTGAHDADVVCVLLDAKAGIDAEAEAIFEKLEAVAHPKILVLNKIDLVPREKLLALAKAANDRLRFSETFMIAALSGDGIDDLRKALAKMVPAGPFHYPEDQMSVAPMRHLAAEITREKIYRQLHQELPYQSTVETDTWTERKDKSVRIEQTIFVERESQRKIVLGKGGATIKSIGADSRKELAEIVGAPVHLFLFVKVRENWGDDPNRYREMGLEFPKE